MAALCIACDARDEFTVTDNTDTFTLSFDYVTPADVNVAVLRQGEWAVLDRSSWQFENLTTIKISPPPQADVTIYRCTDVSTPQALFFTGNSIKAEDLNANQRQVLNAIEELRCTIANLDLGNGGGGDGDGGGGTCNIDSDCPTGQICYDGICRYVCTVNTECPDGTTCFDGVCLPTCNDTTECPVGTECYAGVCLPTCETTTECPAGTECYDGTCVPTCNITSDCPEGWVCYDGICIPECDVTQDCPEGQECYDGVCLISCDIDTDCPEGLVCYEGVCLEPCSLTSECSPGFICNEDGVCVPITDLGEAPLDGKLYGRENGEWKEAVHYDFRLLPEAPAYGTNSSTKQSTKPYNIEVGEAPIDGETYGRINASWDDALIYDLSLLPPISSAIPEDPCAGVTCATGEICVEGACVADPCEGVTCPPGEVCVNGVCEAESTDPLCVGVTCPPGEECVQGTCEPIEGTDPSATSSDITIQQIPTAPADGLMYGRKDATWSTALPHKIGSLSDIPNTQQN